MKEGVWRPGFVRALLLGGVSFGAVIAAYLLRDSAVQEASQKYQEAKTNLERKTAALDAENGKKLTDALEALQKSQEQYWTSAEASARGVLQAEFDAKLKSETTSLETRKALLDKRTIELETQIEEVKKKYFIPAETITKLPCTTTLPAQDIWAEFLRAGFLEACAPKLSATIFYDRMHNGTHLTAYAYGKYSSRLAIVQQDAQGILFTAHIYAVERLAQLSISDLIEDAEPAASFILSDGNTIIVSRYDDAGFVRNIVDGKTSYFGNDEEIVELHKQKSLRVFEEFKALYKQDAGFFRGDKPPETETTK